MSIQCIKVGAGGGGAGGGAAKAVLKENFMVLNI